MSGPQMPFLLIFKKMAWHVYLGLSAILDIDQKTCDAQETTGHFARFAVFSGLTPLLGEIWV
jgi:hypothetical protein